MAKRKNQVLFHQHYTIVDTMQKKIEPKKSLLKICTLHTLIRCTISIKHEEYYLKNKAVVRDYPSLAKDNVMLRYHDNWNLNIKKEIRYPSVIHADFESTLNKIQGTH